MIGFLRFDFIFITVNQGNRRWKRKRNWHIWTHLSNRIKSLLR